MSGLKFIECDKQFFDIVEGALARVSVLEAELARALNIERLALAQVKETTAVLDLVRMERDELRAEVERLKAER